MAALGSCCFSPPCTATYRAEVSWADRQRLGAEPVAVPPPEDGQSVVRAKDGGEGEVLRRTVLAPERNLSAGEALTGTDS